MGKRMGLLLAAALGLAAVGSAHAAINATATILSQSAQGGLFQYSVALTNTGDTPIETLWFGWFPDYDLLPSHLNSISSPAGWSGMDAPDTFGVGSAQWVTTTSPLQPGHTLSGFTFTSPDAPATIEQSTSFFGFPTDFSYVYAGPPEVGAPGTLTPSVVEVPEPSCMLLLTAPALLAIRRSRKSA